MSKKSIIAKLLSEEDISVVHKKTKTAAFNVENRELILPIWKEEMSKDISDLFICHEIGHALYTSKDMLQKMIDRKLDKSYVNIIEDARIEKMVQDKYLGTRSCFTRGYNELLSKDFFGLKDKDLNTFNLADRINLHFKGVDNVPFSSVEQTWVDKVANVKTEDEVLDLAKALMDFTDNNEDSQGENQEQQSQSSVGSDDGEENNQESGSDDNTDDSSDDTQSSGSNDEGEEEKETQGSSSQDTNEEEEKTEAGQDTSGGIQGGSEYKHSATTDLSFDKSLDDAMDKDVKDRVYATIPKVNNKVVVDYKSVLEQCKKHYSNRTDNGFFSATKSEITKFQTDSKKVVSYMVKEFEMKKSADLYKRATVSKTGTLNMGALHTYQFNEDLFAKVTTLPGATNHGLVMFFDWSGSMQYNLTQTLKQLFNLVWFCDRVKIPYRVYAFSDAYGRTPDYRSVTEEETLVTQNADNKSDLDISGFRLIEMFSDKMRKNETADMIHYWYMMGCYYSQGYRRLQYGGYPICTPNNLQLGGTPLNHAIVAAMSIIPSFKTKNGIQKVNAVFLTDGVSHRVSRKVSGESLDSWKNDVYITDKQTNTTITSEKKNSRYYSGENQTTILLELLKKRIPDSNVLGFFVAGSGARGIVRREIIQDKMGLAWGDDVTLKKYQKELRTNKVLVCKTAGYDEYYILPSIPKDDENDEDGIQVKENAKTGDLKRAFAKFSKSKTLNRQLLNKFIAQVA